MADSYLHKVRVKSDHRLVDLRTFLSDAEKLIAGKACVYATGSFGRLEAGPSSDLDLFILVAESHSETDGNEKVLLDGIEEIKLRYHLITAVEHEGIPPFDGGGKYLKVHSVADFVDKLGSPQDDYENTLTGRLLMLLESKPLLGDEIYTRAVEEVVSAYFVDYDDNRDQFVPAFLLNDILRMWRTFCVNYEHFRTKGTVKSKIKNLKLKYSRMLTCYSAIIHLLSVFEKNQTVSPQDVERMVGITPTERLELVSTGEFWLPKEAPARLAELAREALELYSDFLQLVHKDADELADEYTQHQAEWRIRSHEFGGKLASLIDAIAHRRGEPFQLYRFILI